MQARQNILDQHRWLKSYIHKFSRNAFTADRGGIKVYSEKYFIIQINNDVPCKFNVGFSQEEQARENVSDFEKVKQELTLPANETTFHYLSEPTPAQSPV